MFSSGLRGRRLLGAGESPGFGGRLTFLFGLLLAMSALTGWYTGEGNGTTVSVIGWHTGTIGKIVLVLGLLAVLLVVLREVGVTMPASVPESLIAIAIGSIATILVLVRIISIPDDFFFASRGVGIWISLACARGDHPRRAARGLRRALALRPGDGDGHRPHRRFLRNRRQRPDIRHRPARGRTVVERSANAIPRRNTSVSPHDDEEHSAADRARRRLGRSRS